MAFIQLPSGKLKNVEKKTLKLPNFPKKNKFSPLFLQLDDAYDFKFQIKLTASIENSEGLQKCILVSGKTGQHLQEKINLQVMDDRLNGVHVRNQFNPLYKNVLQRQNLNKVDSKDMTKFDKQNPIIGGLLTETKAGNWLMNRSFLDNAPSTKDIEIKGGINKLCYFNRNLALKNTNTKVDSDDNHDSSDNGNSDNLPFNLPEVPKH